MPPSAPDYGGVPPGKTLAVAAETLFLVNLLLLPGIAFLVLLFLFLRHGRSAPALAVCHLRQALSASLWAGAVLVVANLAVVALGGYDSPWTWVIVIIYFTVCHSALVLLGSLGLSRAMVGQPYRYPLVGRRCDD